MSEGVALKLIDEKIEKQAKREELVALKRVEQRIKEAVRNYLEVKSGWQGPNEFQMARLAAYLLIKSHYDADYVGAHTDASMNEEVRAWLNQATEYICKKVEKRRKRLVKQLLSDIVDVD